MKMTKLIITLLSLFCSSFSYGTLDDHLKKAEGKGDNHKMRNIDFIYMINLDQRPQKYALSMQYLEKSKINPYRFSAVNGWDLSIKAINDVGLKYQPGMTPLLATTYVVKEGMNIQSHEFMTEFGKTYFRHCLSLGAIGCALSHISVLQDAYDSGYETIWVLEDDIETLGDPHTLSDLVSELDAIIGANNWDVLFTDRDYRAGVGKYNTAYGVAERPDLDCSERERFSEKYTKTTQINTHFRKIAARFGTHSMIIRRSGIVKLLEFAKTQGIYGPYDLENHLLIDI